MAKKALHPAVALSPGRLRGTLPRASATDHFGCVTVLCGQVAPQPVRAAQELLDMELLARGREVNRRLAPHHASFRSARSCGQGVYLRPPPPPPC